MKMSVALTSYLYAKDGLSQRTKDWYSTHIEDFARWAKTHACEGHEDPTEHVGDVDILLVREYLAFLRSRVSPKLGVPVSSQTIHGNARAIKAFFRWCYREGIIQRDIVANLQMPRVEDKVISVFSPQQIHELLSACRSHYDARYPWLAERDQAMLLLMLDTGVRRGEVCNLLLSHIVWEKDDPHILVYGKGRKEREVGLGNKSRQMLHRYVYRARPETDCQHVFLTRQRTPLQPHGVEAVFTKLQGLTDMDGVRCCAHDCRHTYAFNYLNAGGDVMRLSRLLGHTSLAVTEKYLKAFTSRQARKGISPMDTIL